MTWLQVNTRLHPATKTRNAPRQLAAATWWYEQFLATDEVRFLTLAVEKLDSLSNLDQYAATDDMAIRIRGWAATPETKIRRVTFSVPGFSVNVKPTLSRPDVAAAYGVPAMECSGFDVTVPSVGTDTEKLSIKIDGKGQHNFFLAVSNTNQTGLVRFSDSGVEGPQVFAGSIDDISMSTSLRQHLLLQSLRSHKVNVVSLCELLVMSDRKLLACVVMEAFSDFGHGLDTRIDRLRFALQSGEGYETSKVICTRSAGALQNSEVVVLPQARVHSRSLIEDHEHCLVYNDLAARPEYDFVSGQWEYVVGSPMRLGEARIPIPANTPRTVEKGASLLGRNSTNYFHCLIEYLPLIHTYQTSGLLNGHRFLVNESCPPTVFEALSLFLGKEQIEIVSKDDLLEINELLISPFHTYIPDSTLITWEKSAEIRWEPIDFIADTCIAAFGNTGVATRNVMAVRKGGARGILNHLALYKIAEDEGFELIDLMEMTFAEQVNLLNQTKNFVVPGGSGLANEIFMKPNTTVLALATQEQASFLAFRKIAEHRQLNFNYLIGVATTPRGSTPFAMNQHHSDFLVSPRRFRAELRKMKASS